MNINKVGVIETQCKCIFCNDCAVLYEVLYDADTTISKKRAKNEKLVCSKCGSKLIEQKQNRKS